MDIHSILDVIPQCSAAVTAREQEELMSICNTYRRQSMRINDFVDIIDHVNKRVVYLSTPDGRILEEQRDIKAYWESFEYLPGFLEKTKWFMETALDFFNCYRQETALGAIRHYRSFILPRDVYNFSQYVRMTPLLRTESGNVWATLCIGNQSYNHKKESFAFVNVDKHTQYHKRRNGGWQEETYNYLKPKYHDHDIVRLLYQGFTIHQIAEILNKKEYDIRNRLNYLYLKYKVSGTHELIMKLKMLNLIWTR